MNEECSKCGGKGYIDSEEKVEIIRIRSNEKEIRKQNAELKKYQKDNAEKMFENKDTGKVISKEFLKKWKKKRISAKWIFKR